MDRGLQYGDGVFETIKVNDGRLILWDQHISRLQEGCQRLFIPPPSLKLISLETNTLIEGQGNGVIKIIITRGQGGRGYSLPEKTEASRIIIRYPTPLYPEKNYREGVRIRLCLTKITTNPTLAGIKHLNRLENILAKNEWQDSTIAEGLMLDYENKIIEGTMTNVFFVKKGRLITPSLKNGGVAGVMRNFVLKLAQDWQIPHDIRDVGKEQLLNADEIFLTNSLIGIWPVTQLEQQAFSIGSITRLLMTELANAEV